MAGAGGFEPPHGGIKIRAFLTKHNGLHVMVAATLYLGTKGLRAFCQTFDRARALTSSGRALTAAVVMMWRRSYSGISHSTFQGVVAEPVDDLRHCFLLFAQA
jgi:hypothetical protein